MFAVEFSKKLLFFSWLVTLAVTVLSICFSLKSMPMDALYMITPLSWAETGTATGFYFWKARTENRAKHGQTFLKEFAEKYGADIALRMAEIVLKE